MNVLTLKDFPAYADLFGVATQEFRYEDFGVAVYGATQGVVDVGNINAYLVPGVYKIVDLPTMRAEVREADALQRRAVAVEFAERAREASGVREVWFLDSPEMAKITAILDEASLDDELALEAVLTSILQAHPARFDGFLRVYSESDGVPDFARTGTRLIP